MFIDISEVLSDEDKIITKTIEIEADTFEAATGSFPYTGPKRIELTFTNTGKRKVCLAGKMEASLDIPCDRCLEPVTVDFSHDFATEIDLSEEADRDAMEEISKYITEDNQFDTEAFAENEILANMPMKVVCQEDCKGICPKCGKNLNHGSCDCDTKELDPRMAKVLEVFNQFKEV